MNSGGRLPVRDSDTMAVSILVVFFSMLWAPWGQQAFLLEHWMIIGAFLAPVLLLIGALGTNDAGIRRTWVLILLVAYIAHQFEEHWIDAAGITYSFYSHVNGLLRSVFDIPDETVIPLTKSAIFYINTSLVWLVGLQGTVLAPRQPFTAHAMMSIALVNAVSHILLAIVTLSYNPGLVTSALLFIPLSLAYLFYTYRTEPWEHHSILLSLLWAIVAHVLMIGGLLAANVYGLFSETIYVVSLIGWSLVPAISTLRFGRRFTPLSARIGER